MIVARWQRSPFLRALASPMLRSVSPNPPFSARRPVAAWLAGRIEQAGYARLAERLAGEVAAPGGRQPTLVVFELAPAITIGRLGSRADVRLGDDELVSRRLAVQFTGRGGGAVLHGPGQVCVSLFAALADLGLDEHDAGGCLERFERGLAAALETIHAGPIRHPGVPGIFGRTGLLAAVGMAVRRGVVAHGAFVNVCPALELHHRITALRLPAAAGGRPVSMGSVEADIQRRVRLQDARAALVESLGLALGFPQTHIHAGFPIAIATAGPAHPGIVSRVG
jgi:lipoyl(octanoyl) transferase